MDIKKLNPVKLENINVLDNFWSPKFKIWSKITINDVLSKYEKDGVFNNFDNIVSGQTGEYSGPHFYDGMIYEIIRGVSDFLVSYPDEELKNRLDNYVKRIVVAADEDGYLNTWTQLKEPTHRWGENGGFLIELHELYNFGCLIEAGIHYYQATGKINLLRTATKFANYVCDIIGKPPKKNMVPSHSIAEEALVKLYNLFLNNEELKEEIDLKVNENRFLELCEFWIENRGNHCGAPDWEKKTHAECVNFIKEQKYGNGRPSWGKYAQDDMSIFDQQTIEGHAVRATLLCLGVIAAAMANDKPDYFSTALRLWENMAGKKTHITGGIGTTYDFEEFSSDYELPNNAYLETCAAISAAFFHHNMNLAFADARFADELERVLYNNILNGVSADGNKYYYKNPLQARARTRWDWHWCPCCPPMFLKIMGALPNYIYAYSSNDIYVNLFISNKAVIELDNVSIKLELQTNYPLEGKIRIFVSPEVKTEFSINLRLPGWAKGKENPYDLYHSDLNNCHNELKVNNKTVDNVELENNYIRLNRMWDKGDTIEYELPLTPRRVYANDKVDADKGLVALQSGPLVYCLESTDNPGYIDSYFLPPETPLKLESYSGALGETNIITGQAKYRNQVSPAGDVNFTAIPFYLQDNRQHPAEFKVWIPEEVYMAIEVGEGQS